jgi:hypothetical protein
MYIDPSRVDMLARYSARLAAATPEQLSALEGEVRLFIAALWTEATPEARSRFLDAVRPRRPPHALVGGRSATWGPSGGRGADPRPSRPGRRGGPELPPGPQERAGRTRARGPRRLGSSNNPPSPRRPRRLESTPRPRHGPGGRPPLPTPPRSTPPLHQTPTAPPSAAARSPTLAVIGWGTAAAAMTVRSRS